jgi:hypothetical protein
MNLFLSFSENINLLCCIPKASTSMGRYNMSRRSICDWASAWYVYPRLMTWWSIKMNRNNVLDVFLGHCLIIGMAWCCHKSGQNFRICVHISHREKKVGLPPAPLDMCISFWMLKMTLCLKEFRQREMHSGINSDVYASPSTLCLHSVWMRLACLIHTFCFVNGLSRSPLTWCTSRDSM